MRTHYLVGTILMLGSVLLAQTAAPASTQQTPPVAPNATPGPAESAYLASIQDEMQPSPSWRPGPDFLKDAHSACDNAKQPPSFAECFIDQMAKAGAPPEALKFTRQLYKNNGQVGIVGRTKRFGAFGFAWIVYPLRANDNNGLMFLNTDPNFLDVDDLSKLDKTGLPQELLYQQLIKEYPKLEIFPGDRTGGDPQVLFARSYAGDNPNELRFLFSYPLLNGCHACARPGFANYWWTFDAAGKFLGTKLISVTRIPPPIKRARPRSDVPPAAPGNSSPNPETPAPQPQSDNPAPPK